MKHANGGTATPKNADVQKVQLPNGKEAPLLVADLMSDIQMAIISQNVLAKLIALLPSSGMYDIMRAHIDSITNLMKKKGATMEEYVDVLKAELEFHTSVNIIQEYIGSNTEPEPAVVYENQRPSDIYSD